MQWTAVESAHLLRRTTFGATYDRVLEFVELGQEAAIATLLDYESIPDPVWSESNPMGFDDPTSELSGRQNLLYKLIVSNRPLEARLLWFWHGHFTTNIHDTTVALMAKQLATWRAHANKRFLDFLIAMYKDPAMLQYLDGDASTKEAPNENFARENFELFTIGVGKFTETDVKEAARAFTGMVVASGGIVRFDPARHDGGEKRILGNAGAFTGVDVMNMLAAHPASAQRICTKLYAQMISRQIVQTEVSKLTERWRATQGNLKEVMRLLLELPGFWATKNRECLIKTPLEFCVGLVRHLNLPVTWSLINQMRVALDNMGHRVWLPGTPAGYGAIENTLTGSRLLPRYRFAYHCIHERGRAQITSDIEAVVPAKISASDFIDLLAQRLSMRRPGAPTRQAILNFLGNQDVTSANRWQHTLDAMYLLACSPEYQLA